MNLILYIYMNFSLFKFESKHTGFLGWAGFSVAP